MFERRKYIYNEFRDFLRSTLSVLEEDIVENIVRVYDHHCSQEDDVLTATLLVAKDNVEKKYFPFVRTFQSSMNEASNVCSKPCLAAIQNEHINYKGLKSKTLVNLNENDKSTPASSWRRRSSNYWRTQRLSFLRSKSTPNHVESLPWTRECCGKETNDCSEQKA